MGWLECVERMTECVNDNSDDDFLIIYPTFQISESEKEAGCA